MPPRPRLAPPCYALRRDAYQDFRGILGAPDPGGGGGGARPQAVGPAALLRLLDMSLGCSGRWRVAGVTLLGRYR